MGNAASWKSRPLAGNHGRCSSQGYGFCGGWDSWHSFWTTRARFPASFLRSEVTAVEFKPHDYQQYAIEYIETHEIAAILLDMGLGKTAITLTALYDLLFDYFEITRVLVIAPLRVARNTWPQEIEKWDHLKDIRYSVAVGTEKERLEAFRRDADIYIINRENVQWMVENVPFEFDAIVVDELSSFKNWNSKRFKSLMKVRPRAKRVIGLTGTPSGNGLMDLFAEFKVLDMGQRLGRFIGGYRERFFVPDKRNREIIYSYKPREGAEEKIYELISDICISMKAVDHLNMPPIISNTIEVRMSLKEQGLYDEFQRNMVLQLEGEELDALNAAALSSKLTQMANGAVYGEDKRVFAIHDRKLDALEDLIEAAKQVVTLMAIDKKRLKLKEAGLPPAVYEQTPWYAKRMKVPVVKAKIGPKIMTLIAEERVFLQLPLKTEAKVVISGFYITEIKSVRGGIPPLPERKSIFSARLSWRFLPRSSAA